jgi:6-phosphogluconolactonase
MAFRTLLSKVPVPHENIHRIPGESSSPEKAADDYERTLRGFFARSAERRDLTPGGSPWFPRFDLIMLGVGRDGHTASLFPEDPALAENSRWVVPVVKATGSPPVPRVTLTLPVINRASSVAFVVSGHEKSGLVRQILNDPEAASRSYPAAMVRPEGRLVWLLDEATLGQ